MPLAALSDSLYYWPGAQRQSHISRHGRRFRRRRLFESSPPRTRAPLDFNTAYEYRSGARVDRVDNAEQAPP